MVQTRAWRDRNHRWRIEVDSGPYVWVRIYATNAYTESAPLWLYGMRALARWLMIERIELDDLEEMSPPVPAERIPPAPAAAPGWTWPGVVR